MPALGYWVILVFQRSQKLEFATSTLITRGWYVMHLSVGMTMIVMVRRNVVGTHVAAECAVT